MCMPLPFCVYILFSERDKQLYTGYTSNIEQRIINHNNAGTISTRNRIPLKLIFCEFYLFEEDAIKREKYFKTTMGKKAIKLMLANTVLIMGYKCLDVQNQKIFDLRIFSKVSHLGNQRS